MPNPKLVTQVRAVAGAHDALGHRKPSSVRIARSPHAASGSVPVGYYKGVKSSSGAERLIVLTESRLTGRTPGSPGGPVLFTSRYQSAFVEAQAYQSNV